jgi:peptidyl-prolyl cis-trans isomerase C
MRRWPGGSAFSSSIRCAVVLIALAPGCSETGRGGRTQRAQPGQGERADVVSRVNGSVIATTEVDQLMRAGRISPELALRRLQAERLLAEEADRRGYAARSETRAYARQASVQALLARDVESEPVLDAELEAAYATQQQRFDRPELRRATHVLAVLPPTASPEQERSARTFIEQAITLLSAAADPAPVFAALRGESSAAFEIRVEDLPAVPREGPFVPEFTRALFSLRRPGIVPEPVRTPFGYHGIALKEIEPPSQTPKSEALETLRGELAAHKHKQRLDALLLQLGKTTRVRYADAAQRTLAALEF